MAENCAARQLETPSQCDTWSRAPVSSSNNVLSCAKPSISGAMLASSTSAITNTTGSLPKASSFDNLGGCGQYSVGDQSAIASYPVNTVRPMTRPARRSSSAACASPSGRLRVGIGAVFLARASLTVIQGGAPGADRWAPNGYTSRALARKSLLSACRPTGRNGTPRPGRSAIK